jgi:hypothetical protein
MSFNIFFPWLLIWFFGYLTSLLFFKKLGFLFRLILSFALGFGIITFLLSILGFLYNFQLATFLAFYTFLIILLLYSNRKNILMFKFKFPAVNKVLIAVVLPFILLSLLHIFLFPELYRDSLIYAQWAKILYKDKKINFVEGGPSIALGFASNYPSAYQLLAAFIYFFTGGNLIFLRLTSLLTSFLLILLVYHWSREMFKEEKLSLYSILIFISLPFVIFFSRSASQYIYLTFQFSLACYFLWKFLLEKNRKNLYLSVIFAGFAALTSYLGLLFILLLFLTLQLGKKFYKEIALSFLLFFLVASPWYLRNFLILGNPIWPFGGGKYIDTFIQANSLEQLNKISKISGFNYETLEDLKNSLNRLFFLYLNYSDASTYHGLNPIFALLAIPAIFLWLKTRDKKIQFFVLWFLILLVSYAAIVNYWDRYLILISVPTVFLSLYLIRYLEKFKIVRLVLTLFLILLYFNSIYLALFWDECPRGKGKFFEIIENLGNHQKILEICYGNEAKLWKWVNENIPENEIVATTDFKLYYYNKTVIELRSWKLRGLYYSSSINETVKILKENNISYLVITVATEEFDKFPEYFHLVKEFDGKKIYKLS